MERLYIHEILAGNTARFSYFIKTYKDMAFSIAYRITGNREDAEEVVQDAFLKTYQSLGTFRRDAKFSTWLYKVVVNTSLSKIRKKTLSVDSLDAVDLDTDTGEIEGVYKSLALLEQKKIIDEVMDELNVEDRLILTLFYLGEHTVEEVSEITGIIIANVKMKLHRARKKMYLALEKKLKTEMHSLL
jgi:RNA polymerase sigma factor (sigma-70 family)